MPGGLRVRPAQPADGPAIGALDHAVWSPENNPGPRPAPDTDPFDHPAGGPAWSGLVAHRDGRLVGYIGLQPASRLLSAAHVLQINGLAVAPDARRGGIAQALVEAAIAHARQRGARKLSLRVLGRNAPARALYASLDFEVEGVLRAEFRLEGEDVDDVLMARRLD